MKMCTKANIDRDVCERVNKWMDEPAKKIPGCAHRLLRHSPKDCIKIAQQICIDVLKETNDQDLAFRKAIMAIKACHLHIRVDEESSKMQTPNIDV